MKEETTQQQQNPKPIVKSKWEGSGSTIRASERYIQRAFLNHEFNPELGKTNPYEDPEFLKSVAIAKQEEVIRKEQEALHQAQVDMFLRIKKREEQVKTQSGLGLFFEGIGNYMETGFSSDFNYDNKDLQEHMLEKAVKMANSEAYMWGWGISNLLGTVIGSTLEMFEWATDLPFDSHEFISYIPVLGEKYKKSDLHHFNKKTAQDLKKLKNQIISSGSNGDKTVSDELNRIREIRSAISTIAMEIEGKKKQSFTSRTEKPSEETIEINGKQYALEKNGETESYADMKKLAMDDKGNVLFDENGNPKYVNKYSAWETARNIEFFKSMGDGYFWMNDMSSGIGQAVAFILPGGPIARGVGMTAKALGTLGKVKGISNVVRAVDKIGTKFSKAGKIDSSLAVGNRVVSTNLSKSANWMRKKAQVSKFAQQTTSAFLMTDMESHMIGNQVQRDVFNELVDKSAGIKDDLIRKDIKSSGLSSLDNIEVEQRKNILRNDWIKNNLEETKLIQLQAYEGANMTRAINNRATFLNIYWAGLFMKGNSFARNLRTNPYSLKNLAKGTRVLAVEGLKEGLLEEGGFNLWAEKAGKVYGTEGKHYSINDFLKNDFGGSEFLENAVIGGMLGILTTGGMHAFNSKHLHSEFKRQKAQLEELNKIRALDNKANIRQIVVQSLEGNTLKEFEQTLDELINNNASQDIIDLHVENYMRGKLMQTAQEGLSGEFKKILDYLMTQENLNDEEKAHIEALSGLNEYTADMYDFHIDFDNRAELTDNRLERHFYERQLPIKEEELNRMYSEIEEFAEKQALENTKRRKKNKNYDQILKDEKEKIINSLIEKQKSTIEELGKFVQHAKDRIAELDEEYQRGISYDGQVKYRQEQAEKRKALLRAMANVENTENIRQEIEDDPDLNDDSELIADINEVAVTENPLPNDKNKKKKKGVKNKNKVEEIVDDFNELEQEDENPVGVQQELFDEQQEDENSAEEEQQGVFFDVITMGGEYENPFTATEEETNNEQEYTEEELEEFKRQEEQKKKNKNKNKKTYTKEDITEEHLEVHAKEEYTKLKNKQQEEIRLNDEKRKNKQRAVSKIKLAEKHKNELDNLKQSVADILNAKENNTLADQINPNTMDIQEEELDDIRPENTPERDKWGRPMEVKPEDPKHQNVLKGWEEIIYDNYGANTVVNIDHLIATLINEGFKSNIIERQFNFIKQAWENVIKKKVSKELEEEIYKNFFMTFKNDLKRKTQSLLELAESVDDEKDVYREHSVQDNPRLHNEDRNEHEYVTSAKTGRRTYKIYTPHTRNNYKQTGLKLGDVSAVEFEEDGKTKIDKNNYIKQYVRHFLNWHKFKVGDKVNMTFNIDYMLDEKNKITIWENLDAPNLNETDARPRPKEMTVKEFMLELFKDTPELNSWKKIQQQLLEFKVNPKADNILFQNETFLSYIPVGIKNEGLAKTSERILQGGLPSVYWFNNNNVALEIDEKLLTGENGELLKDKDGNPLIKTTYFTEERRQRIEDNRRLNLIARHKILNGENNLEVTVRRRENIVRNMLKNPRARLNSVLAMFKNDPAEFYKHANIGYIGAGKVLREGGNKPFTINGKEIKPNQIHNYVEYMSELEDDYVGYAQIVFQVGVNEKNEPIYHIASPIVNHGDSMPDGKNPDFIRMSKAINKLRNDLLLSSTNLTTQQQEKVLTALSKTFDIDLHNMTNRKLFIDTLKDTYPKDMKNVGYSQYVLDIHNHDSNTKVIDFNYYKDSKQLYEDILSGKKIKTITAREVMLNNMHVPYVFTEVQTENGSIYVNTTQPFIHFEYEGMERFEEGNVNKQKKPQEAVDSQKEKEKVKEKVQKRVFTKEELNQELERLNQEEEALDKKEKEFIKTTNKHYREENKKVTSSKEFTAKEKKTQKEKLAKQKEKEIQDYQKGLQQEKELLADKKEVVTEKIEKIQKVEDSRKTEKKFFIGNVLLREASAELDFSKDIKVSDILRNVNKAYNNLLEQFKKDGMLEEYEFLLNHKDEILGNTTYDGSVRELINTLLFTDEATNSIVNEEVTETTSEVSSEVNTDVALNEKGYNKSSFEQNVVKSTSVKIRLLLLGIKNPNARSKFGNLTASLSFFDTTDALRQLTTSMHTNSLKDLERVVRAKIKLNPEEFGFFQDLLDRLKGINKTNPELVNEILYNFYGTGLNMNFVMWYNDKYGLTNVNILTANNRDPQIVKRDLWMQQLKASSMIIMEDDNTYRVNEKLYNEFQSLYDHIYKKTKAQQINDKELSDKIKQCFDLLGIQVNQKVIDDAIKQPKVPKIINGQKFHYKIYGKNSILEIIAGNLEKGVGKLQYFESVDGIKTNDILLTNNIGNINEFIKHSNYVEFNSNSSLYIAGKTVFMYQDNNAISKKIDNLKTAVYDYIEALKDKNIPKEQKLSGLLKTFKESPITSNSFLLNVIEKNPEEMVEFLDTYLISLEAIKQRGAKSSDSRGITELSEKDKLVTDLSMFLALDGQRESWFGDTQGDAYPQYEQGLILRKGYMNFPTISDSEHLPCLKTSLIHFDKTELNLSILDEKTGEYLPNYKNVLGKNALKLLREQMLLGDLFRIADYSTKVANKKSTNIAGYDAGAIWITSMPSLNNVVLDEKNKDGMVVKRPLVMAFRNYISKHPNNSTEKNIRKFVELHQKAIDSHIEENIKQQAEKMLDKLVKNGLVDEKGVSKIKLQSGNNHFYHNNSDIQKTSAREIAYQYVLNYNIQQKDIQTLFAGDIALYFKDKMSEDLQFGFPRVTLQDIYNHHSLEERESISRILNGKDITEITDLEKEQLIKSYPIFKYAPDFVTTDIHPEAMFTNLLPVIEKKTIQMFKDVQNNLAKRLKELASTGKQYPNIKEQPNYIQIMVNDVEVASENFLDIVSHHYPNKLKKLTKPVSRLLELQRKENKTSKEIAEQKQLKNQIKKEVPNISAYLDITSTDAQEHTSWRENLNQLLQQGRITQEQHNHLEKKLEQQSKDLEEGSYIKPENLLTQEEREMAVMQPTKPLYSGMVTEDINGHKVQRYVYIKSSSFPLLPEMTQHFRGINNLRKNIEKLEKEQGTFVRVSYQSANKVGGVSNGISMSRLEDIGTSTAEMMGSSVVLSRDNFFIQQDKPFKSDKNAKNGIEDKVTLATQFEKILLGDGVNKMGAVFNVEHFDNQLLNELGIEVKEGKIDGNSLEKIYNEVYKRQQQLLSDKLLQRLGVSKLSDIENNNIVVMEKLSEILKEQIDDKQSRKALDLVYYATDSNGIGGYYTKEQVREKGLMSVRADFVMNALVSPNSRKIETALLSLINKNNINLKMPGFSSVVASQQGFDVQMQDDNIEDLKKRGLITTKNFDPKKGLQATRDAKTGKLKSAQVFIANKFKVFNKETGRYDYVDLTQFVDENNVIDTSKLPQELLEMFSFRIPTSSHQSGAVIEIAGFLPHSVGDLMIVPKEHTVQLGEDYDIDVRYVYQYNYIQDENGNLRKLNYSDLKKIKEKNKSLQEVKDNYNKTIKDVVKKITHINGKEIVTYVRFNEELFNEIAQLKEALDNYSVDNLLHAIFSNKYDVERIDKEFLQNKIAKLEAQFFEENKVFTKEEYEEVVNSIRKELKDAKSELNQAVKEYAGVIRSTDLELKVLENNNIALYKSVFMSENTEVQQLITKVLSTDFAEESATTTNEKINEEEGFFNFYSPDTQNKTMRLGADGNKGIGLHSNSVVLNSILQQLENGLTIKKKIKGGEEIPYRIVLGKNVFEGEFGQLEDNGKKRISEYLGESQNSALDNQKLQIMGRRNENTETITVFSLMQMAGLENDGIKVQGKTLSYASLFISQPVLQKYTEIANKLKSSTNTEYGNMDSLIETEMETYFSDLMGKDEFKKLRDKKGKEWVEIGKKLDSEFLYNQLTTLENIGKTDLEAQYYIYRVFNEMRGAFEQINNIQKIVNIEKNGLGISFMETIDVRNNLINLYEKGFNDNGEITFTAKNPAFQEMFGELSSIQHDESYIDIGDNVYIKPNKHYAHKIAHSISLGYNLYQKTFPYDNNFFANTIDDVFQSMGKDPALLTQSNLKEKYEIIEAVKDFIISDVRDIIPSSKVKEIFFNDSKNGTESLGNYLLRLKTDPEYAYIFENPFFKNLIITVKGNNAPTTIEFNIGDADPLTRVEIYNYLEGMMSSENQLPNKINGEVVTEETLLRDLLVYSLVANQENNAIGFRRFLPLSLFQKYGVDSKLRNNRTIPTDVYNELNNTLSKALDSGKNNAGVIKNNSLLSEANVKALIKEANNELRSKYGIEKDIYVYDQDSGGILFKEQAINGDNFVKQYLQHNPDKVKAVSVKSVEMKKAMYELGLTQKDFNDKRVKEFSVNYNEYGIEEKGSIDEKIQKSFDKPFVTIKTNDGEIQLFERIYNKEDFDGIVTMTFRRISTLGSFGFNEYDITQSNKISNIKSNNYQNVNEGEYVFRTQLEANQRINPDVYIPAINKNDLLVVFNNMVRWEASGKDMLLRVIKQFLPNKSLKDIDIKTGKLNGAKAELSLGVADGSNKISIIIGEEFLNSKPSRQDFVDAVKEELLHYITVTSIKNHGEISFNSKGRVEFKSNNVSGEYSVELGRLAVHYNEAIRYFENKHGRQKLHETIVGINSGKITEITSGLVMDAYRLSDVHEFIAGIMDVNSEFSRELNDVESEQGGSVFEKIVDAIARFLEKIVKGFNKGSITSNVHNSVITFLVKENKMDFKDLKFLHSEALPDSSHIITEAQQILAKAKETNVQIGLKTPENQLDIREELRNIDFIKAVENEEITGKIISLSNLNEKYYNLYSTLQKGDKISVFDEKGNRIRVVVTNINEVGSVNNLQDFVGHLSKKTGLSEEHLLSNFKDGDFMFISFEKEDSLKNKVTLNSVRNMTNPKLNC